MLERIVSNSGSALPRIVASSSKPAVSSQSASQAAQLFSASKDSLSLSDASRYLAENKVDFKNSAFVTTAENFTFDLSFLTEKSESLSASGYFRQETQSFNLSFSYSFQREVTTDQGTFLKTFQLDLSMSSLQKNSFSVTPKQEKEDIIDFLKRVVDRIFEVANDKDLSIGSLVFDKEDISELLATSADEAGKKLWAVLSLAVTVAKLKEIMRDNKDAKAVELSFERIRKNFLEAESKKESSFDLSFTMSETASVLLSPKISEEQAALDTSVETNETPAVSEEPDIESSETAQPLEAELVNA